MMHLNTNRPLTTVALLLCMFLTAMEATVVSTAMPTVIGDLGGVELYSWVFTAYMLTSTISVPIFGKASDLFGRKPVLLLGIAFFIIGSAACGMVDGIVGLIAFRALQGLGAGAVQTTSLTIIGDLYSLKERGRIQGLFATMWGLAGISGPLLGAFIVKYASWRWIFFINLPFGIAAATVLAMWFRESIAQTKRPQLDWAGAALLAGGVLSMLFALNGIGTPMAVQGGVLSLGLLVAFIFIEKRAAEPMIPLALFKQRLMAIASIISACSGATLFAVVTYLPLFVQGAAGGTPGQAGATLTPIMVGWPLASTLTGRFVSRLGFRPFIRLGALLTALAASFLAVIIHFNLPFAWTFGSNFLLGLGLGFANASLLLAVQTSVSWNLRGVATASSMFCRNIGGTMAVGALGGYVAYALATQSGVSHEAINNLLGPQHGAALDPELLLRLSVGLKAALLPVFWSVMGIAIVSLIASESFPAAVATAGTAEVLVSEI